MGVCALLTAAAAQSAEAEQDSTALRPGWLIHSLAEGIELRYLPLVVTAEDYPRRAQRAGIEGTSLLNLQLDPSGRLIGCSTAQSSGSQDLDERACELYRKRGQFELRGTSVPVTAQAPVKWMLLD